MNLEFLRAMFSTAKAIFTRQSLFVAVVLLCIVASAATAFRNAGLLMLRNSILLDKEYSRDIYTPGWTSQAGLHDYRISETLRSAVSLDPGSWNSRWALGRAALWTGNHSEAAAVFQELAQKDLRNPLAYMDAMITLSKNGSTSEVVTIYEADVPPVHTQVISDTVALAYLIQSTATDDKEKKLHSVEQAYLLRPDDLYANYYLWSNAVSPASQQDVTGFEDALTHPSVGALVPTDDRLVNYGIQVVPALFENGFWDRETTRNVIAYLVWQHHDKTSVEILLQQLMVGNTDDPEWAFYLGELYQRQGNFDLAQAAYLQSLQHDPEHAPTYFRLGQLHEQQCEKQALPCLRLNDALRWYEGFYRLEPADLQGLESLARVSAALGRANAVALQDSLNAVTDERRVAADILQVSETEIELGPNLLRGDDETDGQALKEWWFAAYLGESGQNGVYVAGEDGLVPGRGLRIQALWSGGADPSDETTTYGEYFGPAFEVADSRYLVSLDFAQQGTNDYGLIFINDYSSQDGFVLVKSGIPDSGGKWSSLHLIVDGPSVPTVVTPLLRNWGAGQLWLSNLEVKEIIQKQDLQS